MILRNKIEKDFKMMTITKQNKTLYLIAKGVLDHNDCANFFSELNRQINTAKDLRCYFEMGDCQGCTPEVFQKDYFLNLEKEKHLEKVAIVSTPKYHEEFTRLLMPFSRAHIRYFDSKDSATAKEWIEV
ncbi:SpoIIAA-like protein [Gillisia mitskevichiae]|uniref:SpoIIAA-like protein n=2 Tax=Gillisia mitskevichiae TaxID=270921 RepID=A0A495PYR3_9FLAO|nr:SpoIIAA-like protein [Gillisia mitskevichiae]|tara:strand:+ start:1232 stop:1618 length:387 start_codon:yes stop_codon:yes gene_type:complete